jgi:hypothetical protein
MRTKNSKINNNRKLTSIGDTSKKQKQNKMRNIKATVGIKYKPNDKKYKNNTGIFIQKNIINATLRLIEPLFKSKIIFKNIKNKTKIFISMLTNQYLLGRDMKIQYN